MKHNACTTPTIAGSTHLQKGIALTATVLLVLWALLTAGSAAWAAPGPESDSNDVYWDDQFTIPGASNTVTAMAKDASGNIYIGGDFTAVGNVAANRVAKWNASTSTWSAMGTGMNVTVYALAVDGSGNVYAGGGFTTAGGVTVNRIAKWNGTTWSALGTGVNSTVWTLATDAAGNVYAGGAFTTAGGVTVNRIAKWNGTAWSALGTGMDADVRALVMDGSGNVYAGGSFTTAGGVTVNRIAKWNGTAWSALGTVMNGDVCALVMDGSGNVYAGGIFSTAGGVTVNYVAKWNGAAWSALGAGLSGAVNALATDAAGNVYAGGAFTTAGGVTGNRIAKWNGTAWSALGTGMNNTVYALTVDGSGNVYAGGIFSTAGGVTASRVAKWNATAWSALGTGTIISSVGLLAADNSGNVYAEGYFAPAGAAGGHRVAKWNGTTWSVILTVGEPSSTQIYSLSVDNSGNVYAGVYYFSGFTQHYSVFRRNGTTWSQLGTDMNSNVRALAVDGSGNVYAGGEFTTAGGVTANRIAKWNGTAWSAMGTGMSNTVYALATDGSGNVYAGGVFSRAGGVTVNYVAKWNGAAWSALGAGLSGAVNALATDAAGNVYAGGTFTTAGGVTVNRVAKWNGSVWSALGTGLNDTVQALAVDSPGNVYAGGDFTTAGGVAANRIAKWNGTTWSAMGTGMDSTLNALAVNRNSLFVGGNFTTAGGKASGCFAEWQPRVNQSSASFAASPGATTLGNDSYGFYKPALTTDASTAVSYSGGLPVTVTLDRADEIQVGAIRVNGAFTLGPDGVQFGGSGATLRVEFSEDDAAAHGVAYTEFRAVKLTYPASYPASKEAATITAVGAGAPVPIRVENGKQIYAITVPYTVIGSTYGAVPNTFLPTPVAPSLPGTTAVETNTITWTWQDNSSDEDGFKVYADPGSADPTTLQATTAADAVSWKHEGLTANTQYAFEVAATGALGDSATTATIAKYTLCGPPSEGNNVSADKSLSTPYVGGTTFTFANPAGFGAGTHGGSAYRVTKFKYVWDTTATYMFTGAETDWNSGTVAKTESASGSYYLHLQSFNAEDVANAATLDYGPFVIDADAPMAAAGDTPNVDQASNATLYEFTVLYIDETAIKISTLDNADVRVTGPNGFDVLAAFVSSSPGTNADLETATYTITPPGGSWDLADEGAYTVSLESNQVTDTAGNDAAAGELGGFAVDFAPAATLDSIAPATVNGPVPVTVVLTEPSADFAPGDIACTSATVSNFTGSGTSYSFDLVPTGTGVFPFSCSVPAGRFTDDTGSANLASNTVSRTCDNVRPVPSLASTAAAYTKFSPIPVTVAFSKAVTGFEALDIVPGNATVVNFQAVDASHYSFALTPLTEGVVTANIAADAAQDILGNTSTAATPLSRTYDITPPAATITLVTPLLTSANTIVFRVAFNESVAPTFTAADITQTGTLPGAVSISGGPTYTVSITPANPNADGTVKFTVGTAITDPATNAYAGGSSPTCTVFNWHGILVQPAPAQQYSGGTKTLSVTPDCAAGTEIAYQWKYDDGSKTIHLGPAAATWDIALVPASNGIYWCEMTYDGETHESDHVTISIADPLVVTLNDPGTVRIYSGEDHALTTTVAGGFEPLTQQWTKNGGDLSGETGTSHAITGADADDVGTYALRVTDHIATTRTSASAQVLVGPHLQITADPAGGEKTSGQSHTFTVGTSGGFQPLAFQWTRNGRTIPGATGGSLTIPSLQLADAGQYAVEIRDAGADVLTSGLAPLHVEGPLTIFQDPQAQRIYTGESRTLFAETGGGYLPVTYQWKKDGAPLAGATDATYHIAAADTSHAGAYSFVVTDAHAVSLTSGPGAVAVADHLQKTDDPAGAERTAGESHTFVMGVSGGFAPLAYQWKRNGIDIAGATANPLTLSPVQASHEGHYTCEVRDACGDVVLSAPALLHVAGPLAFLQGPQDARVYAGQSHVFTVETSGGYLPLTYQWWKGASPIINATDATYTVAPADPARAGDYSVVVTDAHSVSEISGAGTLQVAEHLSLTQQPASGTVDAGQPYTFEVEATGGFTPLGYQWKHGGAPITGATESTFTLAHAQPGHAGIYSVEVHDANTDVEMAFAELTVTQRLPGLSAAGLIALAGALLAAAARRRRQ